MRSVPDDSLLRRGEIPLRGLCSLEAPLLCRFTRPGWPRLCGECLLPLPAGAVTFLLPLRLFASFRATIVWLPPVLPGAGERMSCRCS